MTLAFNIFAAASFLFGALIGSFLNVCILRIPEKKSIVSPPSHCPGCGAGIRFYDNIPVLSYLFLLGKCRNCGERISPRYPLIELITAVASLTCFFYFGLTLAWFGFFILVASLIVITFIDLDHRIIPDVISLPGIVVGFAFSFFLPHITWVQSLIGIAVGGGSLLMVAVIYEAITKQEGMGGGDIKLLAMLGAFLGWEGVLFVIMASSLLGTLVGGSVMLLAGRDGKYAIPFGPFLSLGAVLYLFWGGVIIRWYLGLFSYGGL